MDLLARGYTVEVVSPDRLPDNLADLELRVDTVPGSQLIAGVTTYDGERRLSLDFVHHLKEPMPDFRRRPPVIPDVEDAPLPDSHAMQSADTLVGEPAEAPSPGFVGAPALDSLPLDFAESVDAASLGAAFPVLPEGPPAGFTPEGAVAQVVQPVATGPTAPASRNDAGIAAKLAAKQGVAFQQKHGFAAWNWRPVSIPAGALFLALVLFLALGLRHPGRASAGGPAPAPTRLAAVNQNAVARTSVSLAAPKAARGRQDDFVARDTVTYLDGKFAGAPRPAKTVTKREKRAANRRRIPGNRSDRGIVAANQVIFLNDKSSTKPSQ
jgi:hypothetical protein